MYMYGAHAPHTCSSLPANVHVHVCRIYTNPYIHAAEVISEVNVHTCTSCFHDLSMTGSAKFECGWPF